MNNNSGNRISFATVAREEKTILNAVRGDKGEPRNLVGLAFSGGGIRSATFNLGVLQGLAQARLLKRFDYLSSVSGGGYIGSWFSALLYRKAIEKNGSHKSNIAAALDELEKELSEIEPDKNSKSTSQPQMNGSPIPNGKSALLWLRRYSAFLTPRYGLFSLDTLAALAGLFRNLLLNQAILICMLIVMLLIPYGLMRTGHAVALSEMKWIYCLSVIAFTLLLLAILNIRRGLTESHRHDNNSSRPAFRKLSRFFREKDIRSTVLSAFVGTDLAALLFYLNQHHQWNALQNLSATGAAIYCFGFIPMQGRDWKYYFWALLTGSALGGLCYGYGTLLSFIPSDLVGAFSLVLGPAILIQILCMAAIVHTGLVGRGFNEINREWLGRAGGIVFALEMIWIVFTSLALFAPALIDYFDAWVAYSGSVAWALGSIATFVLAGGNKSGGKKSNSLLEQGLSVAPYLVMAGLLIILSNGLHKGLYAVEHPVSQPAPATAPHHDFTITITNDKFEKFEATPPESKPTLYHSMQRILQENSEISTSVLLIATGLFAMVGALLALRVDINLFSMHQFYRNRLARGYLGASNPKRNEDCDPFTDFAESDDFALSKLAKQRPIHLINTTLNLTKVTEDELSWQERRGVVFLFSPQYCGYQLSKPYLVPTAEYMRSKAGTKSEGVMLGTAIAISGAAASPNMGYHSSPPLAFLMTFFNVRLGRWCPNPAFNQIERPSPRSGLKYLIKELLGSANNQTEFVNLTDGGHFENLGIYELVRRKCKLIIVSDAGADNMAGFEFGDLGNAIQKCRVDLGTAIEMSGLQKLKPREAQSRIAWGRITYADKSEGVLIYLKPLLRGNESVDVFNYAATHPDFPHQSTGDQWFEESQFESYRQLGLNTAQEMLRKLDFEKIEPDVNCDDFAEEICKHIHNNFIASKTVPHVDQPVPST